MVTPSTGVTGHPDTDPNSVYELSLTRRCRFCICVAGSVVESTPSRGGPGFDSRTMQNIFFTLTPCKYVQHASILTRCASDLKFLYLHGGNVIKILLLLTGKNYPPMKRRGPTDHHANRGLIIINYVRI